MTAIERRWAVIHVATLAVSGVLVLWCGRSQWFFGDEWAFLLHRGLGGGARSLLYPHNEHWSTWPILWYRAVFSAVAVRAYWPYMVGLAALHVLTAHLLWRVARAVSASAPVAATLTALFAFYGWGSENLLWAFQVGFIGSLAAGLALVLMVRGGPSRGKTAAVSVGAVLCLPLSGISTVMVGAVALVALARWGWRAAATIAVPPAVVYLTWFLAYGRAGTRATVSIHGGASDIPRYVLGGLSATLGAPFGAGLIGAVLLGVLTVFAGRHARRLWRDAPATLGLAAAAAAMFAIVATGRGEIGQPAASRYLYLSFALLVPLSARAIDGLARAMPSARPVLIGGLAVLTAAGGARIVHDAAWESKRELALRGQMLASTQYRGPVLSDTPDYVFNAGLKLADLRRLQPRGELPDVALTARDRAGAALALGVAVKPAAAGGSSPTGAVAARSAASGAARPTPDEGCEVVSNEAGDVVVWSDEPLARFDVEPSTTENLRVFLPDGGYDGGAVGPRSFPLKAGQRVTVSFAVTGDVILRLPPGPTRLCGVRWQS